MRILMVGAGATGGYFGGRLAEAGRDITFLLRPGRAEALRERGLQILSPHGDTTLRPALLTVDELRAQPQTFDLVVISTKSYQLAGALEDIAPAVGPETMVMPILNGMAQLAVLNERFGAEHILGGSVRIISDLDAAGRVHQMTKLGEWSYGEQNGERTERILAVDAALCGAGFESLLQPAIIATLWQKWWILASMGAVCVLARGTIGQAAQAPYGTRFTSAVVQECTAIATANGYVPDPAMLADHMQRMTDPKASITSSMYRDMLKGAPVEADHILGDLLSRAQGVATPLLTAAYIQLKIYEAQRGS